MIFTGRQWKQGLAVLHLLAAAAIASEPQTPSITGIQSGFGSPTNGNAITAGTPTPAESESPLQLFISGSFTGYDTVTWTVNVNGTPVVTTLCTPESENTPECSYPADGLLVAPVHQSLYAAGTAGAVTITVSDPQDCEEEVCPPIAASAPYTVNPPLAAIGTLPAGLVGVAYSTPFFSGGTPPYTFTGGSLPQGLSTSPNNTVVSGTPQQLGTFSVPTITDSWGNQLNPNETITFTYRAVLAIATTALPNGVLGESYSATVSAVNGASPYTWSATGLPSSLSINSATGVISGAPTTFGTFPVTIRVSDSSTPPQTAQVTLSLSIGTPPPPPLQITTTSLPNGAVGQTYAAQIVASGGTGNYTFTQASGSLPPGIQLALGGTVFGKPTMPGTYTFGVQLNDGQNIVNGSFSITVAPATLTVSGSPPPTVSANTAISVAFSATGGVGPYKFSLSGNAPTGASLSGNTLSGTATAPGIFNFVITATDSETPAVSASLGFSITVTAAPIVVMANLPAGQVGQAYSGQLSATGGTGKFTWAGSAGDGLTVSSSGAVTGTPLTVGTVSVSVTATDSSGATGAGSFSIAIGPPLISITPGSLPSGALTVSYSATLAATGGTPPYTWSASGLPGGLSISSSTGAIAGTPTATGTFTVNVVVTDSNMATGKAALSLTINSAPLKITTTGISSPVLGQSFSLGFSAAGGTPPYTWSATGLPGGVTLAANGTLSGTPTTSGVFPIAVTVTDSNSQTVTENLNLTVALPPSPTITFGGFPTSGSSGSQVTSVGTLSSTYPVDVTVNLTLTFTPTNGADDPNVQFSTGGRTATVVVKAGSTSSATNVAVQTGTVAGTITITAQLIANGTNITPSPAPTTTIVVPPAAPTVTSVTAATSTTGFTVTVVGFDPTRSITQATFTFTPAAGSNLQTTTVTVPAQSLFSGWYQSTQSAQYGSQFSFTMPFTVNGSVSGIASVTVTLTNPTGTSTGVAAPL